MSNEWDFASPSDAPETETGYAQARLPGRTYTSKTFANANPYSTDYGEPSRFVYEVFDDDGTASSLTLEGEEWIVTGVAGSRSQVKVLISREAGALVDVWIQRVPEPGSQGVVKQILRLHREDATRFAEFFRRAMLVEPEGADTGFRVDEEVLSAVLNNPQTAKAVYDAQAGAFHQLVAGDENARDVIAVAGRRVAIAEFERMLEDSDHFSSLVQAGRGPESVWQEFFERNPWILGIGLGAQLLTSWSNEKLEQVVAGHSIAGAGKRADALLRTSGVIKSMVFAEIKHHGTQLLAANEYRPEVWAPTKELSGGVLQVQTTVHRAVSQIGERISQRDADGFETNDLTYLLRPRSFLIVGRLSEFTNSDGAHHRAKATSFELYRRHLHDPEIITFDELFARAQWLVGIYEEQPPGDR